MADSTSNAVLHATAVAENTSGALSDAVRPSVKFVDLEAASDAMDTPRDKQLLHSVNEDQQITVVWQNLNASVATFNANPTLKEKLTPKLKSAQHNRRQVLHGCQGMVRPGEVMAFMGPSGSGKTTLVSVIGGRAPKAMSVTGDVLFNGKPLSRKVKRNIGYVMQDDRLYSALTVHETLIYAARLRLPNDMPLSEKEARVNAIIQVLGLDKCRDTLIGGPMRRGVSGGERKRVSVGHELLINPSVLILDEPTSGLDATTAMTLLTTLSRLAADGRSVLTTIHQPASRLYRQLDRVLLMADGHVMYNGKGSLVHEWFGHLGCKLPYGVNVADFMLDLANGEFEMGEVKGSGMSATDRKTKLIEASEAFLTRCEDGFNEPSDLQYIDSARVSVNPLASGDAADGAKAGSMRCRKLQAYLPSKEDRVVAGTHRTGANYLEQLRVLCVRCAKTQRFEALAGQRFVQLCAVGVIAGLFWWQRGDSKTLAAAQDLSALVFFEMIFMSFSALFGALFTFPSEMGMLTKERSSDMYNLSAFYISRTAANLPLDLIYPTAFVIIVYWMGGLRPEAGAFICNWLAVMLGVLQAQSFGLLIGAAVNNVKNAQTVATVVMLTFMLVSGFWIRDVASFVSWVRYLSFIWWSYSLVAKIQFDGQTYYDCGVTSAGEEVEVADETSCPPVEDLTEALGLPRELSGTAWLDAGVLLLMLFVLRYAVYIVLWKKTRKA